ncbi:hypothetical protein KY313_01370 [Candidatus Woesearchaeota archaeon]|nr:hypothetical protein [Candidatus Woesearchaeota archaeon]
MKCLMCKVSGIFERGLCVRCAKKQIFSKVKDFKKDFFGSVPSPFIGRYNYPNVNIGVLGLQEVKDDADIYDNPNRWAIEDMGIYDVLDFRSSLVNARKKSNIHNLGEVAQLVGMSENPVEMEINLEKKPGSGLALDKYNLPHGPSANMSKIKITENVKINQKVEKVYGDNDLKANDALAYLYDEGIDENTLMKILSVGGVGVKRKMVPTRWSITAVDDLISKGVINELKDYNEVDYGAYFGGYLGNYYLVLFLPGEWSFELFEMYVKKEVNPWSRNNLKYATDYENVFGRKEYAKETSGGYYAARLPIVEKLRKMKRKGNVLVFRFITEEYSVPLGVWVVREATRKALKDKGLCFGSKELMLEYSKEFIKKKFGINLGDFLKESILLKERKTQKRLSVFV